MLVRMWRKGNPCALLVGMHIGAAAMENSVAFAPQIKNGTASRPSNSASEYISEETQNSN